MIFSNNSALTNLLQTEECSVKLLMGEGICKATHRFNTGSFAAGEIALDFIYHGCLEYVLNDYGPQRMFVYSCQAGDFEPIIIVSGYRMDLADAIDFIIWKYDDICSMSFLESIMSNGVVGFEALCRLLKSYWYFNSNIKHNQYGMLIQTLKKRHDTVHLYQFPNDYNNFIPQPCITLHQSGTYIIDLTPEYLEKWTK